MTTAAGPPRLMAPFDIDSAPQQQADVAAPQPAFRFGAAAAGNSAGGSVHVAGGGAAVGTCVLSGATGHKRTAIAADMEIDDIVQYTSFSMAPSAGATFGSTPTRLLCEGAEALALGAGPGWFQSPAPSGGALQVSSGVPNSMAATGAAPAAAAVSGAKVFHAQPGYVPQRKRGVRPRRLLPKTGH